MAPLWSLPLIFAALVIALSRSGSRPLAIAAMSASVTSIVGAAAYWQAGFVVLGAGSGPAWAFTALHMAVVLAFFLRGTYLVHRGAGAALQSIFMPDDWKRTLLRRYQSGNWNRFLAILSAILMIWAGQPEAKAWFLANALAWSFASGRTSRFLRRAFEEPGRGPDAGVAAGLLLAAAQLPWLIISRIDPVKWGITQLRVAERDGDQFLIDDLVGGLRRRIGRTSTRRTRHVQLLELLQAALMVRHRMTGDRPDLDDALKIGRSLLTMRPSRGDPDRAMRGIQLANALHLSYRVTNDSSLLEESIRVLRAALDAVPSGSPLLSVTASSLATVLTESYGGTRGTEALREAVELQRQAIAATPTDDYKKVMRQSWKVILSPRTGRDKRRSARAAVTDAMVNAHHLPLRWANLGMSLLLLNRIDEDPDRLTEATQALRRAKEIMPADHSLRPTMLAQLADALLVRQAAEGDQALLDEAEPVLREGLARLPSDHPETATLLFLLGELTHRRARREEAIDHWRRASAVVTGRPETRGVSAKCWGEAAASAGDWDEAVGGYAIAVEMLARSASRALTRADRERSLSDPAGLVRDAAACAIAAGDPERAVELLESGRGILLSQVLDTRSDLGELHARHPALAAEFVRIRDAFDQPSGIPGTDDVDSIMHRHALAEQWDALLAEIRSLRGFVGFLRPRSATELVRAAAEGPIVMLNVSDYRCDALILCDGAVHAVALPDVTHEQVVRHAVDYFSAIAVIADADRGLLERHRAQAGIRDLLEWLRTMITDPVLATIPAATRLWWIPTGVLTFLPVHAAASTGSYTPTIRVLEHARAQRAIELPADMLIVSVPDAGGHDALPGAAAESAAVREHFPSARELPGPDATRDRVLAALAGAPVVHFACHAYSDPATASTGRLILHDTPLGVQDIDGLHIADGRLAFLSACATAQVSVDLLDEGIHLTSAFQLAGYAHVIGTLWPTDDATATAVADTFYAHLASGRPPHEALHEAVESLRAKAPRAPSLWASYIHVGP